MSLRRMPKPGHERSVPFAYLLSIYSYIILQLNEDIGGTSGMIYLIISDMGSTSGQGLDFIDGMSFLERLYYVYDIDNQQVGFATTEYTYATSS